MISAVSNSSSYQYQYQSRVENTSLTDEQKKTLQDIISKYDPETITGDQQKEMMDTIKEAGITPGDDFKEIMDAAGFKPPEKPEGPPPDQASGSSSSSTDTTQQLLDLLKGIESGTTSESDLSSFIQSLQNSSSSSIGTLVNQKA